jgi:hypothetical protein
LPPSRLNLLLMVMTSRATAMTTTRNGFKGNVDG